ncbi:MAG: glycosyltransferase family 4 protein, partial [Alphaproteobacteria bacterium]|nr:glycosyltransferase family 4 protein [Alphaproteobacteria bacterium]
VSLVYHGLDLARFPPPPPRMPMPEGAPQTILSVGRLVAKKGFDVLLEALARLAPDLRWRLEHVGGGPLKRRLARQAERLGIADRVAWAGARPQPEVLARYRAADVFVLASVVAEGGDRDGLPNVLMEAQSQGLACVSTSVSAIPELIEDGRTGLLVPERDALALARAIEAVLRDGDLRARLGAAGAARLRERFGHAAGIDRLAQLFGLAPV